MGYVQMVYQLKCMWYHLLSSIRYIYGGYPIKKRVKYGICLIMNQFASVARNIQYRINLFAHHEHCLGSAMKKEC